MRIRQRIAHDAIAMAERATHTQTTRATRERSFEIDYALSKLRTGSGEMSETARSRSVAMVRGSVER